MTNTPDTINTEALAALRVPFPASSIGKLPKGGTMLDYVGHANLTDRLLTVDPTWNWEPVAWDENGLPAYDAKGGLWIKLTVGGVTRLGYGDGPDPKQRIGDAIRNAAMRFGAALDLWSKEELESHLPEPVEVISASDAQYALLDVVGDETIVMALWGKRTQITRPELDELLAHAQEFINDTSVPVVTAKNVLLAACVGDKGLAKELWGDRTDAIDHDELDELVTTAKARVKESFLDENGIEEPINA